MADLLELVPDAATDARDQEAWRDTEAEGAAADAGLTAGLNMPSALCDDSAPSSCLGHLEGSGRSGAPRSKACAARNEPDSCRPEA